MYVVKKFYETAYAIIVDDNLLEFRESINYSQKRKNWCTTNLP